MQTIRDLLSRNLDQKPEEIVKVNQTDEHTVYSEITEYIATDRIKGQYRELFSAIAEAPSSPHEGVGVWISGFFGSEKSSFAKNLGYILANREVLGSSASDLFRKQLQDERGGNLIQLINSSIPTEVIMFDVSVDLKVKQGTETLTAIMYSALLRELDYATDYGIAELEIELEKEGRLEEFIDRCQALYGRKWELVRKGAQKFSRASAILHEMDPTTYPASDTWDNSMQGKTFDITVGEFVERTFELCDLRRPGRALVFIIDEVGQYVARSTEKIENLRAVVEQFGRASKNRLKSRQAIAPVWIVVTSQEKLDEVVAALDSKRVELAKMQDRFRYRIDMSPADIREVATKRILAKKDEALPILQQLFRDTQGVLNMALRLERTKRQSQISEKDFIQFYPYPPYFIELSIDIMSGIRWQSGAMRHLGGSNRTIIKQAHEMLVSPRTALADKPIGTLITLDKIFELVEGNLSSEKQKDISDIKASFMDSERATHLQGASHVEEAMPVRVAKALCLLEFVRNLPRTETNIAACLVDTVGKPAPVEDVQEALELLYEAQFVRNTPDGWKLQTQQEKNWETERRSYLNPKPKDRNTILHETLEDIFADGKLNTYRYRNLRTFKVGISIDGNRLKDGQIPLSVSAADAETLSKTIEEIRNDSRHESHKYDIYWIFALNKDIDTLVADLYASHEMVKKYDQLKAHNKITTEELSCLQDEKREVNRFRERLREKVIQVLQEGSGVFQGVVKDAATLGKTLADMLKGMFEYATPSLYPKLEMAACKLTGKEVNEFLKAANLKALPQVFYPGEQGLGLVRKDSTQYILNPSVEVAREIQEYLTHQFEYQESETRTGKAIERHFGGLGYGWELDVLRLVLAVLFRAGLIEVFHKGQRFDRYHDPQSHIPFTNNVAFRGAKFTPIKPISLKELKHAVESYEQLTGTTVDMEKNAIASALKAFAVQEMEALLPVKAQVKAHHLPVLETIGEFEDTLQRIRNGAADDCVNILAGEGKSLREAHDRLRKIREITSEQNLLFIRHARTAAEQMGPLVRQSESHEDFAEKLTQLQYLLTSPDFYAHLDRIKPLVAETAGKYADDYRTYHQCRTDVFLHAIEEIKGRADWLEVPDELKTPELQSLTSRACEELDQPRYSLTCQNCQATINQMESDIAAVDGLKSQIVKRIQEITKPEEKITRVKVADYFSEPLDSEEAVEQALEILRERLLELLKEANVRIILE